MLFHIINCIISNNKKMLNPINTYILILYSVLFDIWFWTIYDYYWYSVIYSKPFVIIYLKVVYSTLAYQILQNRDLFCRRENTRLVIFSLFFILYASKKCDDERKVTYFFFNFPLCEDESISCIIIFACTLM